MKETPSYDEIVERGLANREIVRSRALRKKAQEAAGKSAADEAGVILPGQYSNPESITFFSPGQEPVELDKVDTHHRGLGFSSGVIVSGDEMNYVAKSAARTPARNAKAAKAAIDGMHDRDPLNQIAMHYARGLASEDESERQSAQNALARLRDEAAGDKRAERKYQQLETLTGFFVAKLQDSPFPD